MGPGSRHLLIPAKCCRRRANIMPCERECGSALIHGALHFLACPPFFVFFCCLVQIMMHSGLFMIPRPDRIAIIHATRTLVSITKIGS